MNFSLLIFITFELLHLWRQDVWCFNLHIFLFHIMVYWNWYGINSLICTQCVLHNYTGSDKACLKTEESKKLPLKAYVVFSAVIHIQWNPAGKCRPRSRKKLQTVHRLLCPWTSQRGQGSCLGSVLVLAPLATSGLAWEEPSAKLQFSGTTSWSRSWQKISIIDIRIDDWSKYIKFDKNI